MAHLNDQDRIAAFQLAIWTIFLFGAIFLCTKHGFSRSSGWVLLVILSLARIIGSSMRLATINDPTNVDLYTGWAVCSGLGLGILVGVGVGVMGRLLDSIRRERGHALITTNMQRIVKLVTLGAIVLFIVGGTQADYTMGKDGVPKIEYPTLSKVGVGIMIAILVFSVLEALYLTTVRSSIPEGEKRILAAVWLAMPFVVMRLVYSVILVLGGYSPSTWFSLGMEVIMEIIATIIFEVMGFTLQKEVKAAPSQMDQINDPEAQYAPGKHTQRQGFGGRFR
ncbi:hypothetical protein LIA77_08753 [Sarocladium implicatum]|nr:hypothetical protein LIA77_08753 [Sarocladium implicatum]